MGMQSEFCTAFGFTIWSKKKLFYPGENIASNIYRDQKNGCRLVYHRLSLRADKSIDYFSFSPNVFLRLPVINYFLSLLLAFPALLALPGKKSRPKTGKRLLQEIQITPDVLVHMFRALKMFHIFLSSRNCISSAKWEKPRAPVFEQFIREPCLWRAEEIEKKKKRMRRGWQSRGVGEGSRERQFYLHSPSKEPSSSLPAIDKAQDKDSS